MAIIVRLQDVIEAMDRPPEWRGYLNRHTGEIVSIPEEEFAYAEDEELDPDELPDWQRDMVREARRVLEGDVWLTLPDSSDIHEWEVMRDFCDELDEPARGELLRAIHGTGAFRMFRATTDRLKLRETWFAFRDAAVRRVAKEWLDENGIAHVDDIRDRAGE